MHHGRFYPGSNFPGGDSMRGKTLCYNTTKNLITQQLRTNWVSWSDNCHQTDVVNRFTNVTFPPPATAVLHIFYQKKNNSEILLTAFPSRDVIKIQYTNSQGNNNSTGIPKLETSARVGGALPIWTRNHDQGLKESRCCTIEFPPHRISPSLENRARGRIAPGALKGAEKVC